MFLDHAKIYLKSGAGGSGVVSFRREKYVPRGGPDGGDGGRGGHIIIKADPNLTTLSEFRFKHHFKAGNGLPGEAVNRFGKNGTDLVIAVPIGTVIREAETQTLLADITEADTEFIILKGGRGGRGNSHFATSTRRTPQFAEKGEPGLELWAELELKLLADVGLIGFPNAGKSTLLSRISAARPKIAAYPFTTLEPNLGVVDFKGTSFVAVDIPGLITGAHQGVGLGDQFLRHIERTRLLVHLIDISSQDGRDPFQDYRQINEELELFNPELAKKPQIIAANKTDLPETQNALNEFKAKLSDSERPLIPISAATGTGLTDLLDLIIKRLSQLPVAETRNILIEREPAVETDLKIAKSDHLFQVNNEALIKRVSRFDLNNDAAVYSLQKLLKHWGVEKALIEAGVVTGDTVIIGDYEFTYQSED